jgi:hypothetical protein
VALPDLLVKLFRMPPYLFCLFFKIVRFHDPRMRKQAERAGRHVQTR